ncbi:hypothetical protein HUJ04_000458 [Dendroctonus ponderosae]|nr:hypothetical protein HUJ04_000458 [Dendroctonus ponderosae]
MHSIMNSDSISMLILRHSSSWIMRKYREDSKELNHSNWFRKQEFVRDTKFSRLVGFHWHLLIYSFEYSLGGRTSGPNISSLTKEDGLLYKFEQTTNKYKMEISTRKTQSLTISKEPRRCKLAVYNQSVEQVMTFKYLGANITSNGNLKEEVRNQTSKAALISGYLRDIIWRNKHMSIGSSQNLQNLRETSDGIRRRNKSGKHNKQTLTKNNGNASPKIHNRTHTIRYEKE